MDPLRQPFSNAKGAQKSRSGDDSDGHISSGGGNNGSESNNCCTDGIMRTPMSSISAEREVDAEKALFMVAQHEETAVTCQSGGLERYLRIIRLGSNSRLEYANLDSGSGSQCDSGEVRAATVESNISLENDPRFNDHCEGGEVVSTDSACNHVADDMQFGREIYVGTDQASSASASSHGTGVVLNSRQEDSADRTVTWESGTASEVVFDPRSSSATEEEATTLSYSASPIDSDLQPAQSGARRLLNSVSSMLAFAIGRRAPGVGTSAIDGFEFVGSGSPGTSGVLRRGSSRLSSTRIHVTHDDCDGRGHHTMQVGVPGGHHSIAAALHRLGSRRRNRPSRAWNPVGCEDRDAVGGPTEHTADNWTTSSAEPVAPGVTGVVELVSSTGTQPSGSHQLVAPGVRAQLGEFATAPVEVGAAVEFPETEPHLCDASNAIRSYGVRSRGSLSGSLSGSQIIGVESNGPTSDAVNVSLEHHEAGVERTASLAASAATQVPQRSWLDSTQPFRQAVGRYMVTAREQTSTHWSNLRASVDRQRQLLRDRFTALPLPLSSGMWSASSRDAAAERRGAANAAATGGVAGSTNGSSRPSSSNPRGASGNTSSSSSSSSSLFFDGNFIIDEEAISTTPHPDDDPTYQQLICLGGLILGPTLFVLGAFLFFFTPREYKRTRMWGLFNLVLCIASIVGVLIYTFNQPGFLVSESVRTYRAVDYLDLQSTIPTTPSGSIWLLDSWGNPVGKSTSSFSWEFGYSYDQPKPRWTSVPRSAQPLSSELLLKLQDNATVVPIDYNRILISQHSNPSFSAGTMKPGTTQWLLGPKPLAAALLVGSETPFRATLLHSSDKATAAAVTWSSPIVLSGRQLLQVEFGPGSAPSPRFLATIHQQRSQLRTKVNSSVSELAAAAAATQTAAVAVNPSLLQERFSSRAVFEPPLPRQPSDGEIVSMRPLSSESASSLATAGVLVGDYNVPSGFRGTGMRCLSAAQLLPDGSHQGGLSSNSAKSWEKLTENNWGETAAVWSLVWKPEGEQPMDWPVVAHQVLEFTSRAARVDASDVNWASRLPRSPRLADLSNFLLLKKELNGGGTGGVAGRGMDDLDGFRHLTGETRGAGRVNANSWVCRVAIVDSTTVEEILSETQRQVPKGLWTSITRISVRALP